MEHSPANKDSSRNSNSVDNTSVMSYRPHAKGYQQKRSQFGKNIVQTVTIEDQIDETDPKNSNQTTLINSNLNQNTNQQENERTCNTDIQFLRQKQENYRKRKEEINQFIDSPNIKDDESQYNNDHQINIDFNASHRTHRSQRVISASNPANKNIDPYDVCSPTVVARQNPQMMNLNPYQLADKKHNDEMEDHVQRSNSPFKMLSSHQLSQGLSFQKEQTQTIYVSMQNTFDSHQNYMYSYSLNSTIGQQQQQIASSQALNQQDGREHHKQLTSKSVHIQRHQRYQFKSLEDFKLFHRKRKCGHSQVLVVDDNQFNVIAIQQQINKLDLKIDMAFSGESALQKIQERIKNKFTCCPFYYLIFMDIDMPVMNGYEATQLITQVFKENNISSLECPIIACSAYVNPEDKQKAFESGMLDYITKPIMLGTLDKVFTHWFVQSNNIDQEF